MQFVRAFCFSVVTILAVLAAGCVLPSDPPPPPPPPPPPTCETDPEKFPTPKLVVKFTIEDAVAPSLCDHLKADHAQVIIYRNGQQEALEEVPCKEYKVEVPLEPGLYNGEISLLDASGMPVTTVQALKGILVSECSEYVIEIDFE